MFHSYFYYLFFMILLSPLFPFLSSVFVFKKFYFRWPRGAIHSCWPSVEDSVKQNPLLLLSLLLLLTVQPVSMLLWRYLSLQEYLAVQDIFTVFINPILIYIYSYIVCLWSSCVSVATRRHRTSAPSLIIYSCMCIYI